MTTSGFRLTLHMVASLDGFIAKKDNSVSWLDTSHHYDKGIAMQNPEDFLKTIDCFVMGSRTYEHAKEPSAAYGWPYGDNPTVVLTRRRLPVDRPNIEYDAGDLTQLVNERLKPNYNTVWVAGGSALIKEFIRQQLADQIRVSILPVILGDGLLYFDTIGQECTLYLKDTTACNNGMVALCYGLAKPQ
jgi:dihydrofolate reductase